MIKRPLPVLPPSGPGGCGCTPASGLERVVRMSEEQAPGPSLDPETDPHLSGFRQLLERQVDRRTAIGGIAAGLLAGLGLVQAACNPLSSAEARETAVLDWQTYFQGNFRLMTDQEKAQIGLTWADALQKVALAFGMPVVTPEEYRGEWTPFAAEMPESAALAEQEAKDEAEAEREAEQAAEMAAAANPQEGPVEE